MTAQNQKVSGLVKDAEGEPLIGATILVKGTSEGTTTSIDGYYEIIGLNEESVLEFSYLGMLTQEVPVRNLTNIDVVLQPNSSNLDEIVVVGYGTQRAGDVTGAVSLIGEEDLDLRPNTQVGSLLYGKAAGVVVNPSSGKPGQGISINIRGTSSIGGSDPLYIVDGVPTNSTRDINPSDIESISILKDASSAAIYGAQGANGVVLITTKSGKSETPTISFNTYHGVSQIWKRLDLLNGEQYKDLMSEIGYNTNWASFPNNTDWQDEIFQNGLTQNYQVSVAGKSNKTNYYVSGGWLKEKGAVRSVELERANLKVNIDQQINDFIKVGTRVSYTNYADVDIDDSGRGGVIYSALITPPVIDKFNPDGSFTSNPFQNWENPLSITDGLEREYRSRRLLGNAFVEVTFLKDFKFKSNLGIEQSNGVYEEFLDPFRTSFGRAIQGRGVSNTDLYDYSILENILTYKKQLSNHNIEASIGYIGQNYSWENQGFTTQEFLNDQITTAGAGINITGYGVGKSQKRNISYISRVNYSFNDKYLLTMNLRRDGSSVFGPDNRYGFFPSASLGWRLSSEDFLQKISWLSDMKLRVGWGINGNDPISPYSYFGITSLGTNYPIGSTIQPGTHLSRIENRTLKWEETTQLNIGFDFSMLNGRISSSIDLYNKQTDDVLFNNSPIPTSTGYSSASGNTVGIQNRGLEFILNSVNINNSKINWTSSLNFSVNRNKVTALKSEEIFGGRIETIGSDATITRLNSPLTLLYGYEFAGVDPDNGRAQYLAADGELTYTPSEEDRKIIGNPHPDFVYGITNTVEYKGFGLSIFLQGSQGNDIINATRFETESMNDPANQSATVLNRWKNPGDITDVPGVSQIGNTENSILSTRFIEDASYLRIKTLTLSYNLPQSLLSKINTKSLSIYVTGENLFTFTNYTGFDPEVNTYGGNSLARGIDYGTYPQTRKLFLGLNLTL